MLKYIIFDFDGTLADSSVLLIKILNGLSSKYGFKNFTKEDLEYLKTLPSREVVKKMGIPKWRLPFLLRHVRLAMKKDIGALKLSHSGLKGMLLSLKESGDVKLGILSSNSRRSIEEFLRIHDIDFFDYIYTTKSLWKKEKKFRKLESLGIIKIDEAIYIVDETRDIISSKKVGLKCAAVTWGYNSKEILEKFEPEYMLKDPVELLEVLRIENFTKKNEQK